MAGVEKIKERILEEARAQAEANIKRAEEEAAKIIEEAKKKPLPKRHKSLRKQNRKQ